MNPPYARREIDRWMSKAYSESREPDTIVVALVNARTDCGWWHRWAMRARELRFLRGRLRFLDSAGRVGTNAPSPSVVVVFDQHSDGPPQIRSMLRAGASWRTV